MSWIGLPFDLQQIIFKMAVTLEIKERACKFMWEKSRLLNHFTREEISEFFQLQTEIGKGFMNGNSNLFKERRSHGIEILELYSVAGNLTKRKPTCNSLNICLTINKIKNRSKLRTRIQKIHALQML
tara:strand:+ start:78 stop:458 length:381 start_codon:yes stop_codon:yes gene_type:complete